MILDKRRCAVAAAGSCAFLVFYAPQAVLPQMAESMGISPAAAGSMIGATTLAVAFSAPLIGLIADRFGCKPTILAATLLVSLPTLFLILASDLNHMLFWRFAQGVFLPAIFSATATYVNEEWPPGEAADVMGIYVASTGIGGFAGRFVTALLADHFGWRAGYIVITALTLLCALVIWKWLPAGVRPWRKQAAAKGDMAAEIGGFRALGLHLRNPALLATFVVGFSVLFSLVATFTYVNFLLAAEPYSFGPSQLGMIFLVYPVGAAVTPVSGAMIRRFGRRGAMVLACTLGVAGMMLTLTPYLWVIIAGLALFVTGVFLSQASAMGFVAQAAPFAKSTAVGLYVCVYYLGGSTGSILPGLLWNHAGWVGCVGMVAITIVCGAVLSWRAWQPVPAQR